MKALVVDDLECYRTLVHRALQAEGFDVHLYSTADSAAEALAESTTLIDLVVTDVQMPGRCDGVDLAVMLARVRPTLPVVIMSSDPGELRRATALGLDVPTLEKPFLQEELLAMVADAQHRRRDRALAHDRIR